MRINKFNIGWQIVRMRAKKAKTLDEKLYIVKSYIEKNKNIHDKGRVKNWVTVMKIHYRNNFEFEELNKFLELECFTKEDNNSDFKDFSTHELNIVLKDLEARKYDFMYSGAPLSHIDFVTALKTYLLKA